MKVATAANLKSLLFVLSIVLLIPFALLLLISSWVIGLPVLALLFFGWLLLARKLRTYPELLLAGLLSPVVMILPVAINPIEPFTNLPDPVLAVRALAGISISVPENVWPEFWWAPQLLLAFLYGTAVLVLSGFSVGRNLLNERSSTKQASHATD
ncbi:MAG: hypothetical protein CMK07_13165 [Ponticaulis sp.]|nr:hypothetical protein [Ponticaulis sp.]